MNLDLTSRIEGGIRARKLFRDGEKILAGVSGGVDSMVLLAVLHLLAKEHGWKLTVAHFNHRLRGRASDADERLVRRAAKSLGLPVAVGRGNVKAAAHREGTSVEMAARALRHKFFARTAARRGIWKVALAHHADDQVELFFLRLLRGAGNEGLVGMRWTNASPEDARIQLARPLLDIPKADLEAFANARGFPFSEDATNASLDIPRNRIRLELLPLLRRRYQPALTRTVLRCMELARADSDFVSEAAQDWLGKRRKAAFARLPVAVQRHLIQRQLFQLQQPLDFELIEQLRTRPNQFIAAAGEVFLVCTADGRVSLRRREGSSFQSGTLRVNLARRGKAEFGRVKLSWENADAGGMRLAPRPNVEQFDADKVGAKASLRFWQPGDRFQPIGAVGETKLQDLFTNLKVPAPERRRRVVGVTSCGRLFWVEGLRMAEQFKLDKGSIHRLIWKWERVDEMDKSELPPQSRRDSLMSYRKRNA